VPGSASGSAGSEAAPFPDPGRELAVRLLALLPHEPGREPEEALPAYPRVVPGLPDRAGCIAVHGREPVAHLLGRLAAGGASADLPGPVAPVPELQVHMADPLGGGARSRTPSERRK
jgi:hypothetical protein